MIVLSQLHDPKGTFAPLIRENRKLLAKLNPCVIGVTKDTSSKVIKLFDKLKYEIVEVGLHSEGKLKILKKALKRKEDWFSYHDFDKILHWFKVAENEFFGITNSIPQQDFLILGRSAKTLSTYPASWITCEGISNLLLSKIINRKVDALTSSCVFNRKSAEIIVKESKEKNWGSVVEWPLLIYKKGLKIGYKECKGLTWEDPDRFLDEIKKSGSLEKWKKEKYEGISEWEKRISALNEQTAAIKRLS